MASAYVFNAHKANLEADRGCSCLRKRGLDREVVPGGGVRRQFPRSSVEGSPHITWEVGRGLGEL